jgi:hypothetical protein
MPPDRGVGCVDADDAARLRRPPSGDCCAAATPPLPLPPAAPPRARAEEGENGLISAHPQKRVDTLRRPAEDGRGGGFWPSSIEGKKPESL